MHDPKYPSNNGGLRIKSSKLTQDYVELGESSNSAEGHTEQLPEVELVEVKSELQTGRPRLMRSKGCINFKRERELVLPQNHGLLDLNAYTVVGVLVEQPLVSS